MIDVTAAVADIASVETNLSDVGLAILGLAVIAVGFKYIKAMMFS